MGNSVSNPITGRRSDGGQIFPRLEIDEFCQDPLALNLFLLALSELQKNDPQNLTDVWSWFSLSGIHGSPFVPYNDVQSDALSNNLEETGRAYQIKESGGQEEGYCTHGSVLL
jgi:tyrosinase